MAETSRVEPSAAASRELQNLSENGRRHQPWVTFLTPPNPYSKTGGRSLCLAFREYRSKWWRIQCFCSRPRKDGTCQTLDGVIPFLAHPERVRFEHVKS